MEDNFWWKMTFDGRQPCVVQPLIIASLWWKMAYSERRPFMKYNPLVEEDLWWKTAFDEIRQMMRESLWWKTTFQSKVLFYRRSSSIKLSLNVKFQTCSLLPSGKFWWGGGLHVADLRLKFDKIIVYSKIINLAIPEQIKFVPWNLIIYTHSWWDPRNGRWKQHKISKSLAIIDFDKARIHMFHNCQIFYPGPRPLGSH